MSVLGSLLVDNGVFTGRCKVSPNSTVSPDYGRILLNLVAREDSRRQALRVGQRVTRGGHLHPVSRPLQLTRTSEVTVRDSFSVRAW